MPQRRSAHHVIHHTECGYDTPFWNLNGSGTEGDVGLDEYICEPGQVIQAGTKFNNFSNRFQGFFIADNGNTRFYQHVLLDPKANKCARFLALLSVHGPLDLCFGQQAPRPAGVMSREFRPAGDGYG
jgi:hypothetical protein